jgi:hypothetical protein
MNDASQQNDTSSSSFFGRWWRKLHNGHREGGTRAAATPHERPTLPGKWPSSAQSSRKDRPANRTWYLNKGEESPK